MTEAFHRILKGRRSRKTAWSRLADALLPGVCIHCEHRLRPDDGIVCDACRARLASCRRDRVRFIFPEEDADDPARVLSLWIYASGSPVRTLHRALKYGGRSDIGDLAGREMGRLARRRLPIIDRKTVVVPVPSHPIRIAERGYNHAEMLARGVCEEMRLEHASHGLGRIRLSLSQSSVTRGARDENVQEAFTVLDPARIARRPVIIVDDVFTTGATLRETTSIVRAAGATGVAALTMAIRIVR